MIRHSTGYKLANDGQDTRAIQHYLGHRSIASTVRYTALAPDRFNEPDPRNLMRPFPAGVMRMWPISTRVNKPENDDPSIVDPIELATNAA